MPDNLTDVAEQGLANYLVGAGTFTIVQPLTLALMSAVGTDSAVGTEVTGGSYARQTVTFSAADATGKVANTNLVSFTNMPAVTVAGFTVYDSSATPQRLFYGPVATSRTLTAGDTYQVAAGALTFALS